MPRSSPALRIAIGNRPDWTKALRRSLAAFPGRIDYVDFQTADLDAYDLHVPMKLVDAEHLRQRRSGGETVRALLPTAEATRLCNDKLHLNHHLIAAGMGDLVPDMPDPGTATGPLILKQRCGAWGRGSRILTDPPDEIALAHIAEGTHFLQRYEGGRWEWSSHLLLRAGRVVFHRTVLFDVPATPHVKGHAQMALGRTWLADTAHIYQLSQALARVGFRDGTCCVDYRVIRGIPRIFEINPRFGGSLVQRAACWLSAYAKAVIGHDVSDQARSLAAE